MRSVLITGCSSGIGYDAAGTLHRRGWRVFATCRQEEDCVRLRDEGLESFRLDYTDEYSLREAVAEVDERTGGTLDALFNNGAYAIPGAVEDVPRDALRAIFETNLFGPVDLIQRCLPMLHASGDARVVNCSSVLGFAALSFRGAYNATKFAMDGTTDTLRRESKRDPITYILIEPGPIRLGQEAHLVHLHGGLAGAFAHP
jgi:NAD(P)-dependent dehydrogenase (short-subunit alcohol dehydrogenase family)